MILIPNILSILRAFCSIPFFYYFAPDTMEISIIVLLLAGLTNMFDGILARRLNKISIFGYLADAIADKIFIFTVLYCFTFYNQIENGLIPIWMSFIILFREVVVMLIQLLSVLNISNPMTDRPPWGKPRMFSLAIVAIIGMSLLSLSPEHMAISQSQKIIYYMAFIPVVLTSVSCIKTINLFMQVVSTNFSKCTTTEIFV